MSSSPKHTCRCTCQAYGGHCDCWFDGNNKGLADERARIVAWLEKQHACGYDGPFSTAALDIMNGEHLKP